MAPDQWNQLCNVCPECHGSGLEPSPARWRPDDEIDMRSDQPAVIVGGLTAYEQDEPF
jgi:hypothetical protein